jgi:hypothetical protein
MDYKEFQEQIVDYLSGNLSKEERESFEAYLKHHPEHQEEFEAAQFLWKGDEEETPEPSLGMDENFYTLLNSEVKKGAKQPWFQRLEQFLFGNLPKQLAYTVIILAAGFFVGNNVITGKKVEEAQAETQEVRSQLVLTLLDQPSANKRLQAVNEVTKLNEVTETIIKALFSTLNNDPNVNVRLSAMEALKNYIGIPQVREGLVASIVNQKSPIVQIELANLMVDLQEKKAVKSFEKLINEEDVNTSAKEKMEESIREIY